ncbi:MAG: polyphosphate polymerase domain-containing protein [Flavobacteriales bacterium]|nr:polyphosphate polymerase domain-containing protein [Flavobacteriales bacterium]
MSRTSEILTQYTPISLEEMDEVKLLNRIDSKYVLNLDQFDNLLFDLIPHYKSLEINQLRSARYQSLYFDTENLKFFRHHHNGRPNRHKVRIRKYLDSDLCFLEVKHKHKGRTDKKRMIISDFEMDLSESSSQFVYKHVNTQQILKPSIWNSFERITLVNNQLKERLTFDIGLNFRDIDNNSTTFGYSDIIIVEVKQEHENRDSPVMLSLKDNSIRKARISKYCIGMGLLNPELKQNNFKKKYLLIDKITNL